MVSTAVADSALIYDIDPERQDARRLTAWMVEKLGLKSQGHSAYQCRYLDSFDWRLYRQGSIAEYRTIQGQSRFVWRNLNDSAPQAALMVGKIPAFAEDFAPPGLRARLADILEMRALMTKAETVGHLYQLTLEDKEGKALLRIELREEALRGRGRNPDRLLPTRLWAMPVRGYEKEAGRILKRLEDRKWLIPAKRDTLLEALDIRNVQAGDYSSKLNVPLERGMRADAAARDILSTLLEAMRINESGMKRDVDSEFLHDFRVAVRRARTLLTQYPGVLPQNRLQQANEIFSWLGGITSQTRDLDVYLLDLPRYRASLKPELQPGMQDLHDYLVRHQAIEQKALAATLNEARYKDFMRDWRIWLSSKLPEQPEAKNALRPAERVAAERIWKVFSKVIDEGRAIKKKSPPEALHDLRKRCKKLRYLLEFFRNLFDAKAVAGLIKALKGLQDQLGTYQDLSVQQESLQHFAAGMAEEGVLTPLSEQALQALIDDLAVRERQVREEFAERFAAFDSKPVHKQFQKLFAARKGGKA